MLDTDRYHLLFGPYRSPRCRVGCWLKCLLRGRVQVAAMSDGLIPWPMTRSNANGSGSLVHVLCGSLARAIRRESEVAVSHWWSVCQTTAWKWRRALGVPATTEGTTRLRRAYSPEVFTAEVRELARQATQRPQRNAKIAAARRGKSRPLNVMAKVHAANLGRKASEETRQRMSEAHRRRGTRPPACKGPPWTADEDRTLGTAPDRQIAARLGRCADGVYQRRKELGIPSHRPHRPASPRKEWAPAEDALLGTMPDAELAAQLGCTAIVVFYRRQKLGIPAHQSQS